jgi:hypothetical protein
VRRLLLLLRTLLQDLRELPNLRREIRQLRADVDRINSGPFGRGLVESIRARVYAFRDEVDRISEDNQAAESADPNQLGFSNSLGIVTGVPLSFGDQGVDLLPRSHGDTLGHAVS